MEELLGTVKIEDVLKQQHDLIGMLYEELSKHIDGSEEQKQLLQMVVDKVNTRYNIAMQYVLGEHQARMLNAVMNQYAGKRYDQPL